MKVRRGFVSNSSSTSFICTYCGERFEAMDDQYGCDCPHCGHKSDEYPEGFTEFIMNEQGLVPSVWVRKFWRNKGEAAIRIRK